mgnify:CR=1 FL=1
MAPLFLLMFIREGLLNRFHDGFKSFGIIHGQIGKNLAIDLDILCIQFANKLGIAHTVLPDGGIDALDPELAKLPLFVATVTIGISLPLFPGILCYGIDIFAGTEVTLCKL